ncbi:MAG TPA: hypothetical protein VNH11_27675 [Pirellulales bacterium]|nr:hypothetical protein [Pirellulales bacterium]
MKQDLLSVLYVEGQALAAFSSPDGYRFAAPHALEQRYGYVNQLIVDLVAAPDGAQHQDPLITAQMGQCVVDKRSRRPLAGLGRAELRDAHQAFARAFASLGLQRQACVADLYVCPWAVWVLQYHFFTRPARVEKGALDERLKVDSLRR